MHDANPMPQRKIDFRFILICTLISFSYAFLMDYAFSFLQQDIGGFKPKSVAEAIFMAVILAPPIETFICQALPYAIIGIFRERLQHWFKHTYIILSALFFAFGHTYSNGYVLTMYVPGIVLAYSYVHSKEQYRPAFTTTMLIHLLYNGLALLWNYCIAGAY
ncbi:CPBP family intramembrane glutamic endopeptidase [Chitinophaga qingshengii]|uniref:CPBP family intramembrane metalloprotease n=1 Tax=Chitinophaga qingshengii TaxID=1569794 RepID=A0ABR7TK25_9BACT|nr:CPBP family intramembrane glutamic endopeptidase [Chitinophaga qingshengii]MBC9930010.1 CPBP family intramembrane metalloprotease [Chitinophaga qingshengii]